MVKICTHYCIGTEFLDILLALGTKPKDSDAGLGGMSITYRPDGSYGELRIVFDKTHTRSLMFCSDMCYLMIYIE
jgi:hypothetical protein